METPEQIAERIIGPWSSGAQQRVELIAALHAAHRQGAAEARTPAPQPDGEIARLITEAREFDAVKLSESAGGFPAACAYLQTLTEDLVAMLEALNQRADAELSQLFGCDGFICGLLHGQAGPFVGGCKSRIRFMDAYRCVDCTASFHRDCLRKHFQHEHQAEQEK